MNPGLRQSQFLNPITQYLHQDYAQLRVEQTIGEALAGLRLRPPGGRIIYFYVLDAEERLVGVVPVRRLLLNTPETRIGDIMVKGVIAIPITATLLEACEFFTLHRLLAFPVVDNKRRVIGVIDVQLYTDELADVETPDQADDLFQLIGVHLNQAQQASPVRSFQRRFPWLLCNIGGGILAAFLSGFFETELQKAVALALFIPVVLALAESVSIQSVSLVLQSLHGDRPSWRGLFRKLRRESMVGIAMGLCSALLVGIVAWLWIGQWKVTFCLVGGIIGGVTGAALIGMSIPYLMKLFKRDPQVASGPIALTVTDVLTLVIYFNLARMVL